jgi:hypothetical protein
VKARHSYHMNQSVKGPLHNWDKREWNRVAKAYKRADGSVPTGPELKDFFLDRLGDGWLVLPIGLCDNFDKKKGCMGHPIDEEKDAG